ncbi:twin-arginine translocase subunit TatC [Lentibacillus populi]|uniref:twin-arginine translocase subunit TatC n=1 Tax=Lentibacillus populi TaxID=1827502 RepID=UPI00166441E9|nr:twin-arginine translocase subunit TatC [Lentibacillus populi]
MNEEKLQNSNIKLQTFAEHIGELRGRIIITVSILLCLFLISYFSTPFFLGVIKSSATQYGLDLNVFKVTESVKIYIKIMLVQALSATIPIIVVQIYLFIKPALNIQTRKMAILLVPIASILFFFGAFLGFYVISPILLSFFINVSNTLELNTVYNFTDFFDFIFAICIVFGLILELPAFLSFLTLVGIVSVNLLKKLRKFIYPILCLFSMIVTPPDFFSEIIVMSLVFILFEISLLICSVISSKQINNSKKTQN